MKNQKGVSMITLIITIIVIIILAAIAFVGMDDATGNAQFSGFAQEFGDFQNNFQQGPLAAVQVKYGTTSMLTKEQQIWLASDSEREDAYDAARTTLLTGITVPAGKSFTTNFVKLYNADDTENTTALAADVACYDLDVDVVDGYTRGTFYGDNLGKEKYFVTENGLVFTLPGYPRTVDGENRFYITPTLYYKGDKTATWDAAVLTADSEIVDATGSGSRDVTTFTVAGDAALSEAIEAK